MILDCFRETFNVIPCLFICLELRIIQYIQRPRTPKTSNMERLRVTALLSVDKSKFQGSILNSITVNLNLNLNFDYSHTTERWELQFPLHVSN